MYLYLYFKYVIQINVFKYTSLKCAQPRRNDDEHRFDTRREHYFFHPKNSV